MLVDWLGAAPLLITKLKAAIPSLEEVQVVSSQAEAQAIAQLAPSCFVAWGGDNVGGYAGSGSVCEVSQRWAIILVTKPGTSAGPLLSSIISALSGVSLSEEFDPLHYSGAIGSTFDGAFVYSTVYFSTAVFATA
jgi:hypothetical protein